MIEVPVQKMDRKEESEHREKMLSFAIKLLEGKNLSLGQEQKSSSLTLSTDPNTVFLSDVLSLADKLSSYVKQEG
jgi:hypothetical protein